MDMFHGMFGMLAPGMCRISMDGNIAVKTTNGYKAYSKKTGRLVNCGSFVFDIGSEFFFLVPTNKVRTGDIILVNGSPRYVLKAEKNLITVINYEDSTVDTVIPERHVLIGNAYFYGKIVSMFGQDFAGGKKGFRKIMKYKMLSEMMNGLGNQKAADGQPANNGFNPMAQIMGGGGNPMMQAMLTMMMFGGGNMDNLFDDMLSFGDEDEDDDGDEDDTDEPVKLELTDL